MECCFNPYGSYTQSSVSKDISSLEHKLSQMIKAANSNTLSRLAGTNIIFKDNKIPSLADFLIFYLFLMFANCRRDKTKFKNTKMKKKKKGEKKKERKNTHLYTCIALKFIMT